VRFFAATLAPIVLAAISPASAQTPEHRAHQVQTQPPPAAQDQITPPDPHSGHDMSAMPAAQTPDPHAGHDMSAMASPGADAPESPPPALALSGPIYAADSIFDPQAMAASRAQLRREHGAVTSRATIFDQLEATFGDGEEGYAWDAQGWYGGDIHRFWWKSEGEGAFGGEVEVAEVQALYSRAFTPYFDVQAGLRQSYRPEADRTDLVFGVQGLAPYWFEVAAAAFLSNQGELTARAEAEYDVRLTQRLILQPRAEINLSAQDIPELAIGEGVSAVELGARLRYEIRREFAPYIGVEWASAVGNTRDFLQARGRDRETTQLLVGVRTWF